MSLLPVGFGASGDDYEITDSLRFRSASDAYLSRTFSTPTNNKKWSYSVWMKRGTLSTNQAIISSNVDGANYWDMRFNTSDQIYIQNRVSSSNLLVANTTAVYRDPSSWYHIMFVFDSDNSTASNRNRLYINSVEQTLSANSGSSNASAWNVNAVQHNLGVARTLNSSGAIWAEYDGYQTEINFVDGQALDPTAFGEYDANGTWKAKDYTGTYGTNGFYLPMKPTTQAEGFNTVLYTGTGASQSIDGVGFSPDLVWLKGRSVAYAHGLYDVVRGVTKKLSSNLTNAEVTDVNGLTSFGSDGFTLGSDAGTNQSGQTYVAWCWDAGSGSAASNTNGSITSTVKANDTYGFSIASYVGTGANATIGHGLSAAPDMLIVKNRSGAYHWIVQHSSLGATKYLTLSTTDAAATSSAPWNNTAPTSSVFSLGTSSLSNRNGNDFIAYCFSEVAGYSKFGGYTGTGSAGNSVTGLGFQPAWLMIKCSSTASTPWVMYDNTREPDNDNNDLVLQADNASAELDGGGTTRAVTFDSDGFTLDTTYGGNNGSGRTYIYMAFADTADARFNFDASGNKNNWLPNNINSNAESETTYDLMKDTPSLVDENAANFAVLNPLNEPRPYVTYSDANLTVTNTTSNAHSPFISTIGMAPNSGKYYWESIGVGNSNTRNATGIGTAESMPLTTLPVGFISGQAGFYIGSGTAVYFYDESGTSTFNVAWSAGNVFMHCYDANTGKFWVGQNGVWYNSSGGTTGDPATGANPTATLTSSNTYFPLGTVYNNSGSYLYYNFGQRPLAYTPPTGFKKLNTFNLPDSTIEDGSDYFNTVLYSGNGTTDTPITGVGFQPDFVWLKDRTNAERHILFDAVRGPSNVLSSSTTSADDNRSDFWKTLDSDGFTLGYNDPTNRNGDAFVAWNWKANGSGVSNTDGSITSTVSANTTAGFSIVNYTGTGSAATVGHGLGAAPKMVIVKNLDSVGDWSVYSSILGGTKAIKLNTTAGEITSTRWNNTDSTNSIFNLGSANSTNTSGDDFIAYCFAEVEGYSSFGSYTGNGSADGTFVYTGFRPAWILIKQTNGSSFNWNLIDTSRSPFNTADDLLAPNAANAEVVSGFVDALSNGFKCRNSSAYVNGSGSTYIYMAFAENPFKNANAR